MKVVTREKTSLKYMFSKMARSSHNRLGLDKLVGVFAAAAALLAACAVAFAAEAALEAAAAAAAKRRRRQGQVVDQQS